MVTPAEMERIRTPGFIVHTQHAGRVHHVKLVPPWFDDVWRGFKLFELRRNDREFKVGDELMLEEYDRETRVYSGRCINAKIIYILESTTYLQPGYVAMSIVLLDRCNSEGHSVGLPTGAA